MHERAFSAQWLRVNMETCGRRPLPTARKFVVDYARST
jgi:hypothetical protein